MGKLLDGSYQYEENRYFGSKHLWTKYRDDPNCYANLNEKIAKLGILNLVLAGDWNLVLDPTLDYCNYKRQNNVKAPEKKWKKLLQIAVWLISGGNSIRKYNASHGDERSGFNKVDWTFKKIYISENLCNVVKDADISPGYRTHHYILTLELAFGEN